MDAYGPPHAGIDLLVTINVSPFYMSKAVIVNILKTLM